jgi:hypothetical protein
MHISEVARLVPFMSFGDVEAVVVDAVKYDYLQVRRDWWWWGGGWGRGEGRCGESCWGRAVCMRWRGNRVTLPGLSLCWQHGSC